MADIVFHEKTGCRGNARQKALLAAAGHRLIVRDIRHTPWTRQTLAPFFAGLPVADWFNRSAPAVKEGRIVPEALAADAALALLLADPLLIRRPLLQVGDRCRSGFDAAAIDAWIGLAGLSAPANLEQCQHNEDDALRCGD